VIETSNAYEHKGPDGIPGQYVFVELISPLHDDCDDLPWDQQLLEPACSIYTFNIAIRNAAGTRSGMINLTLGPDEVRLDGDRKKFNIVITNQSAMDVIRNSLK